MGRRYGSSRYNNTWWPSDEQKQLLTAMGIHGTSSYTRSGYSQESRYRVDYMLNTWGFGNSDHIDADNIQQHLDKFNEFKQHAIDNNIIETNFTFGMSPAEDQFKDIVQFTPQLTKKQKELNAAVMLFGDVMQNSMMDATNSQESFFQSFIDNIKRAIKQLLIQLSVMTAINLILGGKGTTLGKAFGLAKTSLLGLANGGLATGPTMALVGEGSGTSISNPEVIAPLDKLKNYIGGDLRVTGRLVGNDIFLSNDKAGVSRNRFV